MKISILTNMITPYRVPFFKAMALDSRVADLRVLVCVDREIDRHWEVKGLKGFAVVSLAGFTLNLRRGNDAFRIIHLRFGIFIELFCKRPDILIIGDASWTSYLAVFACKLLKIRYVVWNEVTTSSKVSHGVMGTLRRWMYRGAYRLVASCEMAKKFLIKNNVIENKINLVYNAVDNEFYLAQRYKLEPNRDKIREELGIAKNSFCFIYVGQLISRKRIIETVQLISQVSKKVPVHFIIAGTGPLYEMITNKCLELRFDSVTLHGFVDPLELSKLYVAADSLILLSDDEPWGMVVNEILLFNKGYVTTDSVAAGVELAIDKRHKFSKFENIDQNYLLNHIQDIKKFKKQPQSFDYDAREMTLLFLKALS